MSTLIDIQSQIEKLQKQATDIKAREFDRTVQEIIATMRAFSITPKDLQSGSRSGKLKGKAIAKVARHKAGKATGTVAAKYSGPNGETWSGRGLTPRWLASLLAEGKLKEDFVIKS
ncbi:MAG: H-NS histone family protein [Candidatus Saccharibacteria bacterium]|nr:H-NS histone family protein [Rhodoferax sp.]